MTEELWSRFSVNQRKVQRNSALESVHQQPWPKYDPKLVKKEKVVVVVQINGKLRDRLEVTPEVAKDKKKVVDLALASHKVQKYLPSLPSKPSEPSRVPKTIFVPGKLVNFVVPK